MGYIIQIPGQTPFPEVVDQIKKKWSLYWKKKEKERKRIEAELVPVQENSLPGLWTHSNLMARETLAVLSTHKVTNLTHINGSSHSDAHHIRIYSFNLRNLEGRKSFQG